jgi:hypothetical protein
MRKVFSLAVAIAAGAAVAWVPCSAERAAAQESKEAAVKKPGLGATPAKSFRSTRSRQKSRDLGSPCASISKDA